MIIPLDTPILDFEGQPLVTDLPLSKAEIQRARAGEQIFARVDDLTLRRMIFMIASSNSGASTDEDRIKLYALAIRIGKEDKQINAKAIEVKQLYEAIPRVWPSALVIGRVKELLGEPKDD